MLFKTHGAERTLEVSAPSSTGLPTKVTAPFSDSAWKTVEACVRRLKMDTNLERLTRRFRPRSICFDATAYAVAVNARHGPRSYVPPCGARTDAAVEDLARLAIRELPACDRQGDEYVFRTLARCAARPS